VSSAQSTGAVRLARPREAAGQCPAPTEFLRDRQTITQANRTNPRGRDFEYLALSSWVSGQTLAHYAIDPARD